MTIQYAITQARNMFLIRAESLSNGLKSGVIHPNTKQVRSQVKKEIERLREMDRVLGLLQEPPTDK